MRFSTSRLNFRLFHHRRRDTRRFGWFVRIVNTFIRGALAQNSCRYRFMLKVCVTASVTVCECTNVMCVCMARPEAVISTKYIELYLVALAGFHFCGKETNYRMEWNRHTTHEKRGGKIKNEKRIAKSGRRTKI